jgi:hypothetical protein
MAQEQQNRPTGETPSKNRGFNQVDHQAQNEVSQRVANNTSDQERNEQTESERDGMEIAPEEYHRKDPSSINQERPAGYPPDIQMAKNRGNIKQ